MTRSRRFHYGDDTGSLPSAVLLTMVGVSMSALLIPMVLGQLTSTRQAAQRVHALHAAQAGLDTALGHIRAAVDSSGNGVLGKLPCGKLTGSVGAGGTARYEVTITYYPEDPQKTSTPPEIDCKPGGGTESTPAFVLLSSVGTDAASGAFDTVASRTIQGTYTVQTTNQNIAGGQIKIFKASSTDLNLCLGADTTVPAIGTEVKTQICVPGRSEQKFGYFANLNLILISSKTTTNPLGMCLDAGSTPHAVGRVVRFEKCASATSPRQQWSFNDTQNFEGTSDGATLDGYCFNVLNPNTKDSRIVLGSSSGGNCHNGPDSNTRTFHPDKSVGAGAAGESAGQLVNFNQFGRCLDVTQQNVTSSYLIAWPCKQAPDPANVKWNQKWSTPTVGASGVSAPGRIVTDSPSGPYCLKSPGSTSIGVYVTLAPCPASSSGYPELSWTRYGKTDRYETSYRIVSSSGHCLATVDQDVTPTDYHNKGDRVTKIVLRDCSSSTLQKWNADPNIGKALPLKDLREN